MNRGFKMSSGARSIMRRAVRRLGLGLALMAAQAGLAGSAQAAYLTYDFSLSGQTDSGTTLSIGATLTLNGVSQAPTGTGYLRDTDNAWTITINDNYTDLASLSEAVFADTGGDDTYLIFDGGAITGSYFRGFFNTDDNGLDSYYTDANSGMDVLYQNGGPTLSGYNSLTPRPTTDSGSGGTDPGSGGTDPGSGSTDPAPTGDVLSVTAAVPEPATWAMMIGGFGLVGAAMRRRRRARVAFA